MLTDHVNRLLLVDIESTCWRGRPPQGQTSDIIEIGLSVFSRETLKIEETCSILVRPTNSRVSKFCTELTSLTSKQVADGLSFADACLCLKEEYRSHKKVWASWGDYDRRQFEEQCEREGVSYPFGRNHINLKYLFSLICRLPHDVGVTQALDYLGLDFEGTPHRGVDDAHNMARILQRLLEGFPVESLFLPV